jgi:hypothetical protein
MRWLNCWSSIVSERVVDRFELVDVEHHHADLFPTSVGQVEGVLQPVLKHHPIGQAGQRIVSHEMAELSSGVVVLDADSGELGRHAEGLHFGGRRPARLAGEDGQ